MFSFLTFKQSQIQVYQYYMPIEIEVLIIFS